MSKNQTSKSDQDFQSNSNSKFKNPSNPGSGFPNRSHPVSRIPDPSHSDAFSPNLNKHDLTRQDLAKSDLTKLTNFQLETELKSKVQKENEILIQILHLLAEVERRRLYSHKYPSLFDYCVRELKYSSGSAQRRIDTMRAMKLMPEIEEKLQTRELQLVVVSKAQSFFRQERKLGKDYDLNAKRQLLSKLEGKSSRECEKELVAISPQSVNPDRRREINELKTELRITINRGLVDKLDHLKSLLSSKHSPLTDQELIEILADIALKKLDPALRVEKGKAKDLALSSQPEPNGQSSLPTTMETNSAISSEITQMRKEITTSSPPPLAIRTSLNRYIPASLKSRVWRRDLGQCTHPNCGSKYKLQLDHIKPLAKGGETTLSNLRLLCQTHNLLQAQREFGLSKINQFIKKREERD